MRWKGCNGQGCDSYHLSAAMGRDASHGVWMGRESWCVSGMRWAGMRVMACRKDAGHGVCQLRWAGMRWAGMRVTTSFSCNGQGCESSRRSAERGRDDSDGIQKGCKSYSLSQLRWAGMRIVAWQGCDSCRLEGMRWAGIRIIVSLSCDGQGCES